MYGRAQKCAAQLEADQEFLEDCARRYPSREVAAAAHVHFGWQYFAKNQNDAAIKRFNQAWLLDSTNAEVYRGFGTIMGMRQEFRQAIALLQRSLALEPDHATAWGDLATTYTLLHQQSKNVAALDSGIIAYKTSLRLLPGDVRIYGQLTTAYTYRAELDSARKYMRITEQLDPAYVQPDVREMLKQ